MEMELFGTIRIKNPRTLQSWIDKGWFHKEIDNGYIFAPACGRFRTTKCECSLCRKPNGGDELKYILIINKLL